jgi:Do/DeqQ family serine protease
MHKFWSSLLAGIIGGLVTFGVTRLADKPVISQPSDIQVPAPRQVNYDVTAPPFDFVRAAERSMSAVVHIKATESRESADQRRRQTDPFYQFFGDRFGDSFSRPRSGSGSGVIFTQDGYIMTNNHVVEFADEFEVTLHDNRKLNARLVGRDQSSDMAVIKIEAENLTHIDMGNSDEVRVGQWVLAVGNPFELTSTVTAGIVSAKGRDINVIKNKAAIESFIQTDAAVNPGNSGGALVDTEGRLIGINSAIASPTGAFAGYSFAIPVNLAKRIAEDLIKYGTYKRPYLGVDIADLDNKLADELQLPYKQGVVVLGMDPEGSAAKAGIEINDIIIQVNDKNVTNNTELRELIARSKLGDDMALKIVRKGKQRDVLVHLRSRNNP